MVLNVQKVADILPSVTALEKENHREFIIILQLDPVGPRPERNLGRS